MSHELRTPLNGVMGIMQLLQTSRLDEEQKRWISMAIKSSERLARLLTDILDISRIEAGRMELVDEEFNLQELCDSVCELFIATSKEKDVSLECAIDASMPLKLIGDAARIRQVLFNLVGNAQKFTERGKVTVDMVPLSSPQKGTVRVLFSISDTGIGIPDDKVDTLFKPFVQVDGSYTRSHQGAGLGLAIVKRLVDLMGGKISMESTVGKGTTVHVVLPLKLPKGKDIPAEQGPEQSAEARQSLRILLAEDEPSNALPVMKLLQKAGHKVALAENGQQTLDLFTAQGFDVILMDVQMPVMDGVEATKRIRSQELEVKSQEPENGESISDPQVSGFSPQSFQHSSIPASQHSRIPIIALTAYAMAGDREKFLEAGMDDYLSKPVKMEDLERVLERNIRS